MRPYTFIRSIDLSHYFEIFVVSAIASIIGIRFFLWLTGFPQLGAGELHIAHMLWGGLLLLISILGLLTFLNNDLKSIWAMIGGAGFGTFIDEVGKFVTSDNNYFFQPTFALIYVIFVLLFITFKSLIAKRTFTRDEYLINSVDELKEVISQELDTAEIDKALHYLSLSDPKSPITRFLKRTFTELKTIPHGSPSFYYQTKQHVNQAYYGLISKPQFVYVISLFFAIRTLEYVVRGAGVLYSVSQQPLPDLINQVLSVVGILPVLYVLALLLQALFTVMGIWHLRSDRGRAYTHFISAILISLFILQVYNFYNTPLLAFFSTVRDVLLLSILEYMIVQEKTHELKVKALL